MWAAQTFGPFLYDFIAHKPYTPIYQIWSPAADAIFNVVLWVFGFGYLMGDAMWHKQERDYYKESSKAR